MDVDGLPIIGPGVDYTQVNQFMLKLYIINSSPGFVTSEDLLLPLPKTYVMKIKENEKCYSVYEKLFFKCIFPYQGIFIDQMYN